MNKEERANYCPNCGADIESKKNFDILHFVADNAFDAIEKAYYMKKRVYS